MFSIFSTFSTLILSRYMYIHIYVEEKREEKLDDFSCMQSIRMVYFDLKIDLKNIIMQMKFSPSFVY